MTNQSEYWTEDDINYLKSFSNDNDLHIPLLADILGRSTHAVTRKAVELGMLDVHEGDVAQELDQELQAFMGIQEE